LYKQLLALALASGLVGVFGGGWDWGLSAAAGPLAGLGYYALLAGYTRRLFAVGRVPFVLLLVLSLVGRQLVCVGALAFCYFQFGQPWLACLATLFVSRHWVLVAAWSPAKLALAPAIPATT
jgi:hypothetical protein